VDEIQAFLSLLAASALGMLAIVFILIEKRRHDAPGYAIDGSRSGGDDDQVVVAMEGQRACPRCAMGNSWAQRECISCGAALG
jgi:hypothetical protein